jgi:hypothetical protein
MTIIVTQSGYKISYFIASCRVIVLYIYMYIYILYIYVSTSTRALYKLTLQVQFTRIYTIHHYIDIIHKSNSFHKSKPVHKVRPISNSIHIIINGLELAFQSHEGVGTEDYYVSGNLGHGKCL